MYLLEFCVKQTVIQIISEIQIEITDHRRQWQTYRGLYRGK